MPNVATSRKARRPSRRTRGKPRFGMDEVVRRVRFDFQADQLSVLAALLGRPELANESEFAERLSAIATDYRTSIEQRSQSPSRATINANLLGLREGAEELADRLEGMDVSTGMEVTVARLRMGAPEDPRWKEELIEQLRDLSDVLRCGHASSSARRGPTGNLAINRAALRLMVMFEEFAERRATHNPYDNLEYKGAPMSAAGRFASAFFKIVDASVTQQRICSALAWAVKEMKRT